MMTNMRNRAGPYSVFFVGMLAACGAFIACGLDDTAVETLGAGDASTQASDGSIPIDAAVYDAGSDATIGTTICTALTLCDDAGGCAAGAACIPPIPAGWSLAGFDPANAVACAAGYAAHGGLEITDGGAAQCSCGCIAGTPPSCTNVQAVLTTGAACATSPTTENVSSTCAALPGVGFSPTPAGALEAHLQAAPDSCGVSLSKTIPSWDAGAARECDFAGDAGEFCSGHATCVASSGAPHSACIVQAYAGALPPTCVSSCPSGFTASCEALADTAIDTRDCAACTCGWNNIGCNTPTVTFSAAGNCSGPTTTISPDTCASTTIATIGGMFVTGSATTPSCGKMADTSASGNVAIDGERIVCCAN